MMEFQPSDPFLRRALDLLTEVRLSPSASETLDAAAASVIDAIRAIPDRRVGPSDVPGFVRDIGAPPEKLEFTFHRPDGVVVAGSHAFGCVAKPDVSVDLLVRMPKECFYEKDYLNHQYHARRCLYLFVIAEHMKSLEFVRKVEWSTFQNEGRKPVLHVFPDMKHVELSRSFIRIIPAATSLFGVPRLNLLRNNVRAVTKDGSTIPTPKYNSSILEDMFLEENAEFVRNVFSNWKSLKESLILFKVWARQRSTIYLHDCLNGFLISVIISYLTSDVGGNRIGRDMNAWQIFRVTLDFIATSKVTKKGIFLQFSSQHYLSNEQLSQYCKNFDVVLCDKSGHVNFAFRMTRSAFLELQEEASLTLNSTKNPKDVPFEDIFMTKVDFPARFDYHTRVNILEGSKILGSCFCLDNECWRSCEHEVQILLERALKDRVRLVRVTWKNTPMEWDVKEGFSAFLQDPMHVGILINSCEKSFRMVDVGPNAEDKEEAAKFRNFWGEKAELRRFKDGTIAESTVWNCEASDRHLIVKKIIAFILSRHLHLSEKDVFHIADQLDFSLHHGSKDPITHMGGLLAAFEVLSKRLRLLDDIPLRISYVQPIDPAFRSMSVFPPEPHPLAYEKCGTRTSHDLVFTCIQPLEVMIQLEGSGKWPMDQQAIEKTKSAFLLKIGESLQAHWGVFCTASENEVDVLLCGYAFRLRILHERALSLLKNPVGNGRIKEVPSSDKYLFFRSQHASMINGLNGRYPIYGPVVRLAKRWVSSHLFSCYLAEEAVELLVAYIFLRPFPFTSPCSRITGFLRFLRLLSTYDWTFSPLVVDINNDLGLTEEQEIKEKFNLSRKSYEENPQSIEPVMFLATSYDKSSEAWTITSPKVAVLKRLVSYARSSADLLANLILGQNGSYTWEVLFKTPLNNYDAVVLLHPDKLPYPGRLLFPSDLNHGKRVIQGSSCKDFQPFMHVNHDAQEARDRLMVGFDPTRCLLNDLKDGLSREFNIWYDSHGGDAIGLTWQTSGEKKRSREEVDDMEREATHLLKGVGEAGKGFIKSVHLIKPPKVRVK